MFTKKMNPRISEIDYGAINKLILNYGDMQKNVFENANFQNVYYLSDWRCNYLRWFPFEKGKKILDFECELGTSTTFFIEKELEVVNIYDTSEQLDVIKKRVNHKNVEYVKFNSCLNDLGNTKFDYIVVGSTLNLVNDPISFLSKIRGLLNEDGFIMITGFNKLGLSYLSGKPDFYSGSFLGSIINNAKIKQFDKFEYEEMLDQAQITDYRFYYPYPDHLFTEILYTDKRLPDVGEIKENLRNYNKYNLHIANDAIAFDSAIENMEFAKFANSFLIVIGQNVDALFKYIKVSNERDKKFQIYTTISNNDNVVKHPCSIKSFGHIQKMRDYYNYITTQIHFSNQTKYCDCELIGNSIKFEYIEGETLEKKLSNTRLSELSIKCIETLKIVEDIIKSQEQIEFTTCAEFNEVFGTYYTLEGENASINANIDLILDNIIINDFYNVIDYEWTFNFPIPNDFILFRTIFHSTTINRLNQCERKKVYLEFGIDEEKCEIFINMEKSFQQYVSKDENKILTTLEAYNNCNIFIDQLGVNTLLKELVVKDDNSEIVSYNYVDNYINMIIDLEKAKQKEIKITPNKGNCIMNISGIWGLKGEECTSLSFSSNAIFKDGSTYFFDETAIIVVSLEKFKQIRIEYAIYYTNSDITTNVINLNMKNNELLNELTQLNTNVFVKMLRKLRLIK